MTVSSKRIWKQATTIQGLIPGSFVILFCFDFDTSKGGNSVVNIL